MVRVKRGSIAILRTMGATPGTIVRAFFLAAAAVGMVGTVIGAGLGLLICANMPVIGRLLSEITGAAGTGGAEVDFITSMPVRVQAAEVSSIVAVAIVLSLVAAAYPAWRSARIEPVEGLRHE
jgi:lipoprotein-releasing system permease protein